MALCAERFQRFFERAGAALLEDGSLVGVGEWRAHAVGGRASEIRDAGFVSDLSLARRNEQSRSICAGVEDPFQVTQNDEAWSSPANE